MAKLTPDPDIVQRISDPKKFGGPLSAIQQILKRLAEAGLSRKMKLKPTQIGMHPMNWGKYGANHRTVHSLADDIGEVGWNWTFIVEPLAVEEDPSDSYIQEFNKQMVRNSEYLAPVEDLTLLAGSLTNGHTVQLLRAILAAMPSSSKTLSINGRLS